MRKKKTTDYQSYLLRLWRDGAGGPWRASLQPAGTTATHMFASLQALFSFLESETGEPIQEDSKVIDNTNLT